MKSSNKTIKNGFTLAEILLSLTVIGIVAAIALPSLLGNANERAWETQKKALYTRFSQALPILPSLNGYGQLEEVKNGDDTEILDTAAETFVRDGLSKVMKITNICDNDHLTDCGLPDKIIPLNGTGTIELSSIATVEGLNTRIVHVSVQNTSIKYDQLDTKTAAFETVNGESILVYYNPNCQPDLKESYFRYVQPKMCANFVYDLNGKKGPNTVGKDIGIITALYATDPVVIAPNPYPNNALSAARPYEESAVACKQMDENAKMPNIDELASIFYNMKLFGIAAYNFWSSTKTIPQMGWRLTFNDGTCYSHSQTDSGYVRCIKR